MFQVQNIPLEKITPGENSRQNYDETAMAELMTSMRQSGQLQPIGVRPNGSGFMVIFGFRRFQAAQKLGWKTVSAEVFDEKQSGTEALIINAAENLQRRDVHFADQGRVYESLVKKGLSAKEIAARIGVSENRIKRALHVYKDVPVAVRRKIRSTNGRGTASKQEGAIHESTAALVLNASRKFQLNAAHKKQLFNYAATKQASGMHLRTVSALLSKGVPIEKAIKQVEEARVITLQVTMTHKRIEMLEKKYNQSIHQLLYLHLKKRQEFGIMGSERERERE